MINLENITTLKQQYALEAYNYFDGYVRTIPRDIDGNFIINGDTAHNNDVDAFRHSYVSAKLTQLVHSDWIAQYVLDKHEVDGKNSPLEHRMDLYNNELGRRFGEVYSDANALGAAIAAEFARADSLFIKTLNDPRLLTIFSEDPKLSTNTEGVTSSDVVHINTSIDSLLNAQITNRGSNLPTGYTPYVGVSATTITQIAHNAGFASADDLWAIGRNADWHDRFVTGENGGGVYVSEYNGKLYIALPRGTGFVTPSPRSCQLHCL